MSLAVGVDGVVWPAALSTSGEMLPNTRATPQNALECLCFLASDRKHSLPAELVLLSAVVAQAVVDAKRGDIEALRWLHGQGF